MVMAAHERVNPYANLPKVVAITHFEDSGEYGNARCPHCGAEGRYVYYFRCDDGTERGAMKGCFSKFPQHPFAKIHARIMDKQKDLDRINQERRQDRKLASWDVEQLEAIEAFAAGDMDEIEVDEIIRDAEARKNRWLKSHGYRR